jgi:hypothetical protein
MFASGHPGVDNHGIRQGLNVWQRNEKRTMDAIKILEGAETACAKLRIPLGHVTFHSLPAVGGPSGMLQHIVEMAPTQHVDVPHAPLS